MKPILKHYPLHYSQRFNHLLRVLAPSWFPARLSICRLAHFHHCGLGSSVRRLCDNRSSRNAPLNKKLQIYPYPIAPVRTVEGVSSQKGRSQNGRESTNHRIWWDERLFFIGGLFLRPFREQPFWNVTVGGVRLKSLTLTTINTQ